MPLRDLPDSLIGKTVVQISDLHVGPIVSRDYLRDCLELVSSLEPDIVAITGDFVSYDGPARIDEAVALLADMQPGKLATVAITGNHDFGFSREGFTNRQAADSLTEKLDGIGIQMLRNTAVEIEGLRLLGVDDFWGPTHELDETLSSGDGARAIRDALPQSRLCGSTGVGELIEAGSSQGTRTAGRFGCRSVSLRFCRFEITTMLPGRLNCREPGLST